MTSPDLYTHLDVPRSADAAAVRRAYRRRAKKDHPDTGGSPSRFALTKLAHDILTDPSRRERYDSTGDTSEKVVDNTQALILEVVAALLAQTIQNCAQRNISPTSFDLVDELTSLAAKSIVEFRNQRAQLDLLRIRFEKLKGRFTKKRRKDSPGDEPNQMEAILAGQAAALNSALSQFDAKIERFEAAAKIIKNYDFRSDIPAASTSSATHPHHLQAFRIG